MKKILICAMFTALAVTTAAYGDAKSNMQPVLNKAKAEVSAVLSSIDKDLAGAAKKLAIIDHNSAEARKILSDICKGRTYVYDCGIVDPAGKLSVIEPASARKFEGKDVSYQQQIKKLFKTKAPLASKVFTALDGLKYIDFMYPILNEKGKFNGALSLLVRQDKMLDKVIAPIIRGKQSKIWVMQTDGMLIFDADPNQINKNIFTDPMFRSFDSLILFAKTMAEMKTGSGSYSFFEKGLAKKIVEKAAVWDTAGLYGSEWRIVVIEVEQAVK